MSKETIFRVSFVSQGEVYEVYARNVSQGGLFGFIEIEELVFGERSKLLIDSSEERLKTETFPMAMIPPGKKSDS